jgi:hypothetical protein
VSALRRWLLWTLLAAGVLAPAAAAHPGHQSGAVLTVAPDGRVIVRVSVDALAFALNDRSRDVPDEAMRGLLEGPEADLRAALEESHARFVRLTELEVGGEPVALAVVSAPTLETVRAAPAGSDGRPRLPVHGEFVAEGRLPPGARSLTLRLPEIAGDVVLTVERPGQEPTAAPLPAGATAGPIDFDLTSGPSPAQPAPTAHWAGSAWTTFGRFLAMGFWHIVPEGADHVLFVLGLFLGARTARTLLLHVTMFTLAHSATLALATLGVVNPPASIVEPAIALSIALVAAENVLLQRPSPWRAAVVLAFGLVHGLGFAGALREAGLPPGQTPTALAAFNVGVELGQLAVVGAAAAVMWWWRGRPWYRGRVVIPISLLIGVVGLVWFVQRVLHPA